MQHGSLIRSSRMRGPDVWQFRWADRGPLGKRIYRKRVIGQFANTQILIPRTKQSPDYREINSDALQQFRHPMTISEACDHFVQRELSKENT